MSQAAYIIRFIMAMKRIANYKIIRPFNNILQTVFEEVVVSRCEIISSKHLWDLVIQHIHTFGEYISWCLRACTFTYITLMVYVVFNLEKGNNCDTRVQKGASFNPTRINSYDNNLSPCKRMNSFRLSNWYYLITI